MESVILSNDKLIVKITYAESRREFFQRFMAFISPNFLLLDTVIADEGLDLQLILHSHSDFPTDWKTACTTPCSIRHSTAEIFNLTIKCGELSDGRQIAWHGRDQTGYSWHRGRPHMEMYISQESFIHLIEFFRYYLLALEAAKGSMILHASGVEDLTTGNIVAICGVKGAGKTSTMLNLATSGTFRYFSGDKLLVDIHNNELRVRGWPDYPHIGAGSLRQHPILCHKIGLSLNQPPLSTAGNGDKFLFAPELLHSALGKSSRHVSTLEAILLPNVQNNTLTINVAGASEKNSLDSNHLFENPLHFITATWHGLPFPRPEAATEAAHQKVRDRLYQLSWLTLSGNIPTATLTARLRQGTQLRLALVASSGSGKSTTAELLKEAFSKRGLSVGIEKLAQPLYSLQRAYFNEMERTISVDAQHQHLMEKIADNLRMLEPRSLINHLLARLSRNKADVILTDDLRDKETDWPALIEQGYMIIRVLCDECTRRNRLNARHDIQSQTTSTLDADINAIEADIILDNNGDIDKLCNAVNALVEQLLRGNDE